MDLVKPQVINVNLDDKPHTVTLGLPPPLKRNAALKKAMSTIIKEDGSTYETFCKVTFEEEMINACVKSSTFPWNKEMQNKLTIFDYDKIKEAYLILEKEMIELKKKLYKPSGAEQTSEMKESPQPLDIINSEESSV